MNRRTSMLCCLLITAALLCSLPSLLTILTAQDGQRMAKRLQPKKTQTLTVWILSDATEGGKYLHEQMALFEKQRADVRIYLRRADAQELFAENAVLPDVILFSPGVLTDPGRVLSPILGASEICGEDALWAGQSAGLQYGIPLWLAPSVLTIPAVFFPEEAAPLPTPTQTSFFNLNTPAPTAISSEEGEALPNASLIPWQKLLEPNAVAPPRGMDWIQLLWMCPAQMRPALIASLTGQSAPQAIEGKPPVATGALAPKNAPAAQPQATVMTLAAYQNALASGKPLVGFPLSPACTEKVLLLGICNDHTLSRALLSHLLSQDAQMTLPIHALLPITNISVSGDAMALRLHEIYQTGLLFPNAFEYTAEELSALCQDAFRRNQDPVETLLRLR